MMKVMLVFISIILSGSISTAQNESSEIDKLAITAKVWGFLKYYHPNVAKGDFDWDQQLFDVIPKVKKAQTNDEVSLVLLNWIDRLGIVKKRISCKSKKDSYFEDNFNLTWIDSNRCLTTELSQRLRFIEVNRHKGEKYYVDSNPKIGPGNVEITNEKEYLDFDWQDENFRLLTLFRYWNIVEYFFPYKYQTDILWDNVLTNMIPTFMNSTTEVQFHLAMLELIVSVDDSHASFWTKKTFNYFGSYWSPAMFKIVGNKAVINGFWSDSLGRLNDIRLGDVVSKIDGKSIGDILNENKKYINGSNLARKKKNAYQSIFNGLTDSAKLEITRGSQTFIAFIGRYKFNDFNYKHIEDTVKCKIIEGNVGYINLGALDAEDVDSVLTLLKGAKGIIIDVRSVPDGTGPAIVNYISSQKKDFFNVIAPDLSYPGKYILRAGSKLGGKGDWKYQGKVVLLVDEKVQSHGEFTTMILQTGDNVTTIGSQTSGADGNTTRFQMVGGFETKITGIGIFYPDGTITQRNGIKIDIEITQTLEGVAAGRDEILEKAIEFINE
jgi:carboxyl-terminal processing protease